MDDDDRRAGHVFICYARADSVKVDWLQRMLEAAGITVWRDKFDIWPGEDWRAVIRRAISDRALVFIACFSNQSLSREQSYQNEELALAIDQIRRRAPERPWFIPVRFDACPIPDRDLGGGRTLGAIQHSDLFGAEAAREAARLVASIRRMLGLDPADSQVSPSGRDQLAGSEAFEASPPRSWARLLDPRRALVGFVGRERELDALTTWCESSGTDRLRLVTGGGGIGKTRLAVELAERMKKRGWTCQRIADGQEAVAIKALRSVTSSPALLVVDYAETRIGLRRMLTDLARDQEPEMRVLLLARAAGEWWERLGASEPTVGDLVRSASSAHLPLSSALAADRPDAELIAQAVRSFAGELGLPEKTVEIYGDSGAVQRRVLDLHAAALVAVLADAEDDVVRVDLGTVLHELLRHEQHFWYDSAQAHELSAGPGGVTAEQLRQIVAAGCMLGAASQAEARELPGRVPGLSPSAKIAAWLRLLYPPDPAAAEWIGSVQPDRLAELHALAELTAAPDFAQACLTNLDSRQGVRAVALLARASSDYPEAEHLLSRILPDVAEFLARIDAPAEVLATILNAIPYPTVVLAPAAASLGQRLTRDLPASTEPAIRAHWLSSLSSRLSEMRRYHDALPAIEEAIAIRRELAADAERHLPDLGLSLINFGVVLSNLGLDAQALAADQESAGIWRRLVTSDSDRYRPDLALALANLGQRYFALGEYDEALQATEEAAGIRRLLADADPDRYDRDLAESLNTLGIRLSALGHYDQALEVAEQAVAICRRLAAADPDRHRPELARSLGNLGITYTELGRSADALPPAEEVLLIRRELAATEPDRWRPDLASALEDLGVTLVDLNRPAEALPLSEEVLLIRRELAAAAPDLWRPDLACALDNLGATLTELGRPAEGLELCREALEISKDLTRTAKRHEPGLVRSLSNVAALLLRLDRPAEALPFAEDAVAVSRGLAAAIPDRFRPDLAKRLGNLGTVLSAVSRPEHAQQAIAEALEIHRDLAAHDPDRYRPDVASALVRLGVVLSELGRPADALTAEQEAVTIGRELAAADPDTYRPDLAATLDNLSVTLTELRRPAEALATARQAVALYRELDKQDGYRLDLCRSLGNLAQAMKMLGQHEDAAAVLTEERKLMLDLSS